jgi:hypothetical protein
MDTDVAAELRALSDRVRRNVPHRRDPQRFHTEKSCIVQDLEALANRLDDRAANPAKLTVSRINRDRSRTTISNESIGGRGSWLSAYGSHSPFSSGHETYETSCRKCSGCSMS